MQRNSGPWGVVSILAVVMGLVVYGSRTEGLASRIWEKSGDPDIATAIDEIEGSGVPWSPVALATLGKAVESMEAAVAAPASRQTGHLLDAHMWTVLAYFVLHGPVALALGIVGLALGRLLARERSNGLLDVETLQVNVARPSQKHTIMVPELALPRCQNRVMDTPFEDDMGESTERLRELADDVGVDGSAVTEELAKLPLRAASRMRSWLERDSGLSDRALQAYEGAWADGPQHLRGVGRREKQMLARYLELEAPPAFVEAREQLRRRGWLTPLRERLMAIVMAHRDWPASIGQHGGHEGGLLEHYADVLRKVLETGRVLPDAAVTVAVAHDIGKVLSYVRDDDGRWVRADARHAQNTALILSGLPELEEEHGAEAEGILVALAHEHAMEAMPLALAPTCKRLLEYVKEADGKSVAAEAPSPVTIGEAASRALEVLPTLIRDARINRIGSAWHVHGFWEPAGPRGEEVLLLSEQKLREQLQGYLSDEDQRTLSLWRDRTRTQVHPGIEAVTQVMRANGALADPVRGIPGEEATGMVSIRAGKRNFRAMIPVSLTWLEARVGEELAALREHWSGGERFEILVLAPGWNVSSDELTKLAEASRAEKNEEATAPEGRCPACNRPMKTNDEGTHLCCKSFFPGKGGHKKCAVRFRLVDGKPLRDCRDCGKPLIVVKPKGRKPPFMGCPDKCTKVKANAAA